MRSKPEPHYPVYVISKGRPKCLTARWMRADGLAHRVVIEPQDRDAYLEAGVPDDLLVDLPFSNLGQGSIPARNWCWDDALAAGAARHWVVDDNIEGFWRWHEGRRLHCDSVFGFAAMEDFVDRYTNIGIAGPNYVMFGSGVAPPFRTNVHVYSCCLIDNQLPVRWRGRYNEDTDLCLQILSRGLCTVQFNAFLIQKLRTMTQKGGNTDELYAADGRLEMARSLERAWPGIVTVKRRFQRPQHVVNWSRFDAQLERRDDIDWSEIEQREYSATLNRVKPMRARPTITPGPKQNG